MSRIEQLTGTQREALPAYLRKWLEIGLSTETLDREAARRSIDRLYAWMQLDAPEIVWCKSPYAAVDSCLHGLHEAGPSISEPIRIATTGETLNTLAPGVWNEIAAALRIPVSVTVADRVADPLASQVLTGRRGNMPRNAFIGGLFDAHNAAFYDFARGQLGLVVETEGAARLGDVGRQAGWVIPCAKVCFVAKRPTRICRDEQGRLHSADGAAIAHGDGHRLYAWKGIFVPRDVILEPGKITAERVDAERNTELRRCLIERMGADRYFKSAGATLVHEDRTGRLWHKTFNTRDVWAVVEVVNGTAEADGSTKHYFLHVPPRCRTAREAVAWTYGLRTDEYELLVRT